MPLYMCKWPDASCSLIKARNKEDALYKLDEVGDPTSLVDLFTVKNFIITLAHNKCGEIILENLGEELYSEISGKYPAISNATEVLDDEDIENCTEKAKKYYTKAIEKEKKLLSRSSIQQFKKELIKKGVS